MYEDCSQYEVTEKIVFLVRFVVRFLFMIGEYSN